MEIHTKNIVGKGIRFSLRDEQGKERARAFLYILHNDLHKEPFGFLEDVFVDASCRGKGYGTRILQEVFRVAQEQGCYKLIGTSRYGRPRVHRLYQRLGFQDYGKEFRKDFKDLPLQIQKKEKT